MQGVCLAAVYRIQTLLRLTSCRFFAAEGGVKVQVLAEGSGPEAKLGDRVLVDYVLRRR